LVSSDYYPPLQRDNCKLIDWPIATLSPVGVRTSDGIEHHVDCLVFATGYDVHLTGPAIPGHRPGWTIVERRMDRRRTGLQEHQRARLSESVLHDRPELRPRTQFAAGLRPRASSITPSAVSPTILDSDLRYLDVRHDVQRRYNERIQRRLTKTTWMSGCKQLVFDQGRTQRVDVPGVRHPVSSADARFPVRRLRRGRTCSRARELIRLSDGTQPTAPR